MADAFRDLAEWGPQLLKGLSKLPAEITVLIVVLIVVVGAFGLAAFAIWAMHSIAKDRP